MSHEYTGSDVSRSQLKKQAAEKFNRERDRRLAIISTPKSSQGTKFLFATGHRDPFRASTQDRRFIAEEFKP